MNKYIVLILLSLCGYRLYKAYEPEIVLATNYTEVDAETIKEIEAIMAWPETKTFYLSCSKIMLMAYKDMAQKTSKKQIQENAINLHESRWECEAYLKQASEPARTLKESKPIVAKINKLTEEFFVELDILRLKGLSLKDGSKESRENISLIAGLVVDYVTRLNTCTMILDDIFARAREG